MKITISPQTVCIILFLLVSCDKSDKPSLNNTTEVELLDSAARERAFNVRKFEEYRQQTRKEAPKRELSRSAAIVDSLIEATYAEKDSNKNDSITSIINH